MAEVTEDPIVTESSEWEMSSLSLASVEYKTKLRKLAEDVLRVVGRMASEGQSCSLNQLCLWFPCCERVNLEKLWNKQAELLKKNVSAPEALLAFREEFLEIERFGEGLEKFDAYTIRHQDGVSETAGVIYTLCLKDGLVKPEGEEKGWRKFLEEAELGGRVHDLGKLGWPEDILLNREKITENQRKMMNLHPLLSYALTAPFDNSSNLQAPVLFHHEKWNGDGYPLGFKGNNIPFLAQIYAIADVYDALIADRPYRKAMKPGELITMIRDSSGKDFNPNLVKIILPTLSEDPFLLHKLSQEKGNWDIQIIKARQKTKTEEWL